MTDQHSTNLRDDLREAIAVARETWARVTGETLASQAGIGEDIIWLARHDDTLAGQVGAGYSRTTVLEIVKAFADMLGSPVTEWTATENLSGVETSGSFAGLTVTVWGVTA